MAWHIYIFFPIRLPPSPWHGKFLSPGVFLVVLLPSPWRGEKIPTGCISDFGVRRGQEKRWLTTRISIFRVEASVDRYFSHRVTGATVWEGGILEA